MKKLLFVLSMLFFIPSASFAVTSLKNAQTTTLHMKKENETPKNKKISLFLSLGLGFVIGGFLIIKAVPVFAAICLTAGLICCLIALFMIIGQMSKS